MSASLGLLLLLVAVGIAALYLRKPIKDNTSESASSKAPSSISQGMFVAALGFLLLAGVFLLWLVLMLTM